MTIKIINNLYFSISKRNNNYIKKKFEDNI